MWNRVSYEFEHTHWQTLNTHRKRLIGLMWRHQPFPHTPLTSQHSRPSSPTCRRRRVSLAPRLYVFMPCSSSLSGVRPGVWCQWRPFRFPSLIAFPAPLSGPNSKIWSPLVHNGATYSHIILKFGSVDLCCLCLVYGNSFYMLDFRSGTLVIFIYNVWSIILFAIDYTLLRYWFFIISHKWNSCVFPLNIVS